MDISVLLSIAIMFATLLGPVLAVQVQKSLEPLKEARERRPPRNDRWRRTASAASRSF